ncbi:Uncharacterized conserved protein YukE [Amycolatopsis lurida]|uniref:PE domain-containing protein n=1 Tax=Amycolatopsis lurida NRRL 2430 TaxID=1460371 RepID=A0A2P2FG38_AMYLU|nr:WXG100 family type VII secretion target [Amycolatopsis lurida]KFU75674.1 hypothetical protein BB31_40380 [Amycolatopsis lurida NRRL 2430]SEE31485.1 Uncharacterized conserved protein YukE [Amycolatopsis lurida]
MTDEFRLDPDGMRDVIKRLGASGDDFAAALTNLTAAMDRYDGCWGEDKAGEKFAESYVENADGTRDTLKDLPSSMRDAAKGIHDAMVQFQGLDEDNAKLFDQQLAESMQQQESDSQDS